MNKEKLKKLLDKLDTFDKRMPIPNARSDAFQIVNSEFFNNLNVKLDKLREDFDLSGLIEAVQELEDKIKKTEQELSTQLQDRISQLPKTPDLTSEVDALKTAFEKKIKSNTFKDEIEKLNQKIQDFIDSETTDNKKEKKELEKKLQTFKADLLSKLANHKSGGGSMNRKITFGGTDYLTRYTDINYKAGSNVTFSVANNNQTKQVDVTIAASGTGGGVTRSINSVSISTAAGSAASTDYVYLCTGTLTLTLPDATVGNTNLYTIKNVGSGTVTVATTASQTIDGQSTILMPVQFTSIDVISDTANWKIT